VKVFLVKAMIRIPCFAFVDAGDQEEAEQRAQAESVIWRDQGTKFALNESVAFGEGDEIYEVEECDD
jgi:hypothetical protein